MLPALLHAIAFAICLLVQFWGSPLAGAWLFFYLAGCAVLLYQGGYPQHWNVTWYACLAWLITITASALLITPTQGGAVVMWILAAMPALPLCMREEHLKYYGRAFFTVILLFASGLVLQMVLNTQVTAYNYEGLHAWPLLDPNNAAAIVTLGLIPAFYQALRRIWWWIPVVVFVFALQATGSKAGIGSSAVGCFLIALHRFHTSRMFWYGTALATAAAAILCTKTQLLYIVIDSFNDRLPIWSASWPLASVRPLFGLGLGSFGYYYDKVRIEDYTTGWHSHNDLLQIAIEMGLPALFVFAWLTASVAGSFTRNVPASCAMLAIWLMSLVEFQFYIPAVSIPMGLALAYHITPTRKARL